MNTMQEINLEYHGILRLWNVVNVVVGHGFRGVVILFRSLLKITYYL